MGDPVTIPLTWPPTPQRHLPPPSDHLYASALWLLGRYPRLVALVERVPGVISTEDDGAQWFELEDLADVLRALDAHRKAWRDYEERTWQPTDDDAYAAWEARGPRPDHPAVPALGVMSRTEVSRLRLLATFASGRVSLSVSDLGGFDAEGQDLIADWTRAVRAAVS